MLRDVSIKFRSNFIVSQERLAALDTLLAGMMGLERLHLKMLQRKQKALERGFPRCFGKHVEGGLRIIWHVECVCAMTIMTPVNVCRIDNYHSLSCTL